MKILIVGAGIGGLTSALDLARTGAGHDVTLVEREPRLSPLGAGIVLAPNAMRILRWLGVPLEPHGVPLSGLSVVSARGSLLSHMDAARFKDRYGEPWAFARPALHQALHQALPERVRLRLGASVQGLQVNAEGVRVSFSNEPEPELFDLVVGADGLRSTVRALVAGAPRYRYSGTTCYRGLVQNPGIERAIEAWGGAARIGVVPLAQGQLYYYLVLSAEARAPGLALPELRAAFAHIRGEVSQLWAALQEAPPLHHDLDELEAPVWGVARVLLLGDAAHGMTPNQGQGAAMAIEDALALTAALAPGADGALGRYAATRHARVLKVQLDSRRIGQLAHLPSPALGFLRNSLLRMVPRSVADKQYVQLVEPGLALLSQRAA